MTERIHSMSRPGAPRRTRQARDEALQASANAAPRAAMDRVWSVGYMAVSLLAIAAACAVAGGEAAKAELRFATVAFRHPFFERATVMCLHPSLKAHPAGAAKFSSQAIHLHIQPRKSA